MQDFTLLNQPDVWELWLSFWRFEDINALWVLMGSLLLGMGAAVIGSFAFLRKRSLIGDALAHAALPGVMTAFLLFHSRDPWIMFSGALASSFIGFFIIDWLPKHTKIKPDAALAITLSFFFALGLMLLSYIQGLEVENKSGLDKILFGQAAAMTQDDIRLLAYVTVFILLVVTLFFHKFRLIAFNRLYAQSLGINIAFYELVLALLIVMAVVVGLQLVGVVLMAAVLLTPMAAARLWSDNLKTILLIAGLLGALSALISTQISYLAPAMPTGPWMVVSLAILFVASLLFAPQKGLLQRAWQQRRLRHKVAEENLLRTLYKLCERGDFHTRSFSLAEIQALRAMPVSRLQIHLQRLAKNGLVSHCPQGWCLTDAGFEQASLLTRRHRLWESYLNERADLTPEQIHLQAERIEHILTDEQSRQIEAELSSTQTDPHGQPIPAATAKSGDAR
ncbi:metal ABC transporter permease [Thiomicrorhabdus cannonii]|uniref:metal ABC transporter permease n=1 Tax=Thiomicrorhabdus cannonii TaxID=2748011 RepID=UPI0015BB1F40|nr:iron chelate uptake ABC transporter family permease subunit [Thiomicrorhabdus cannonii]